MYSCRAKCLSLASLVAVPLAFLSPLSSRRFCTPFFASLNTQKEENHVPVGETIEVWVTLIFFFTFMHLLSTGFYGRTHMVRFSIRCQPRGWFAVARHPTCGYEIQGKKATSHCCVPTKTFLIIIWSDGSKRKGGHRKAGQKFDFYFNTQWTRRIRRKRS